MKTASRWNYKPVIGSVFIGLVLAALVGSIEVVSAHAKDYKGKGNNGHYENRGRGYDRGHPVQGRRVYRTYGYRERVYVPPPVYYAPPSPPGIGIFLPPIFIH